MKLKKITAILPLIGAFLIFNGFLKLYVYYNHWGIRISDYLDFSEIILSFMNDLNILGFGLLMALLYGIFWVVLIEVLTSTSSKNVPSVNVESSEGSETDGNQKKSSGEQIEDFFEEAFSKHYRIIAFVCFIVAAISSTVFICYPNLFWLYFSCALYIQFLLSILIPFIGSSEKTVANLVVCFGMIGFTMGVAYYDIKQTEHNAASFVTTVTTSGDQILLTENMYLIGKSREYLFFYDDSLIQTTIIPCEVVVSIETRKLR
jgi:hypothetical protein